jgi:hypothetical protein
MLETLGKFQMETRRRERAIAAQEAADAAKNEAARAARLTKGGGLLSWISPLMDDFCHEWMHAHGI